MMTKSDVCARLSISPSTLTRLVACGDIPQYKIGGQCRFEEADIEAYLRRSRFVPAAPVKEKRKVGRPKKTAGFVYVPGMKVV